MDMRNGGRWTVDGRYQVHVPIDMLLKERIEEMVMAVVVMMMMRMMMMRMMMMIVVVLGVIGAKECLGSRV